jgi:hypothetical protein
MSAMTLIVSSKPMMTKCMDRYIRMFFGEQGRFLAKRA